MIVSLGVIILRVREPDLPRAFKVPGYPVAPVLSILACAYLLSSLHWVTWVVFAGWVLVFLAFYRVHGRKHSVVGVIPESVERVIGTGATWSDTLASVPWQSGEVLAIGSSSMGPLARVFLDAPATKLIRHAPVPVIVLPHED